MIFSEKSETPNLTDYLKAKPDSVVYYGDKKSTASWQLLYFIALKLIAAKHPDELMRLERKSILGEMPVSRLRENIASFLDNHPEYCDEFLK